ncbi:hypothetical protein ACJ73_04115 [Blastomyces percursus]|uniref:Uncharacterized protein n=1 Tax=Blastomyces percursus TaxID=1658174 RepID=A0A1J9R7Q4_9EURO|nr:hypothetical protein ACJ73_04115 [Blastomyces percursus]
MLLPLIWASITPHIHYVCIPGIQKLDRKIDLNG